MRISVIIPVLNEAATIASTLENVAAVKGIHEIIVVDGGSVDETAAIASKSARVITSPKGRSYQMNAGAALTTGDVLLFLHADTFLPDNAAGAIEQGLADASVIGGRFRVRLANPSWRYRMVGWSINMRDRLIGGFTGDQAIFVRRETFFAVGGYPPIDLMEDLEFGRRMRRKGKVVILPLHVTTSARRWENSGVFRTVLLMWMLRLLYSMRCPPSLLQRWYGDAR